MHRPDFDDDCGVVGVILQHRDIGLTIRHTKILLAKMAVKLIIHGHNTPQAYPVVRYRDAQTGGLIVFGGCRAL